MREMTVEEILEEVRKQQRELQRNRLEVDATLYISVSCWNTLARQTTLFACEVDKMPLQNSLLGFKVVLVRDIEQYVQLIEDVPRIEEGVVISTYNCEIDYGRKGNMREVVKMLEQEYAGLEDDYDKRL